MEPTGKALVRALTDLIDELTDRIEKTPCAGAILTEHLAVTGSELMERAAAFLEED